MKIGYFADGPWSHKGLEKITGNENFKISFIVISRGNIVQPQHGYQFNSIQLSLISCSSKSPSIQSAVRARVSSDASIVIVVF